MDTRVVVPALTLRDERMRIDVQGIRRYAARAVATWVDRFILSGTTAGGSEMEPEERAAVVDLWLEHAAPTRLLACCWTDADVAHAEARGVAPLVVMQQIDSRAAAEAFLQSLPAGAFVYSHPAHSATVLDPELCAEAVRSGNLPVGAKLAKVSGSDIAAVRASAGPAFELWDASSRNIAASAEAGASGVVATPLGPIASPFPSRQLDAVQQAIDHVQADLDGLPSRSARAQHLERCAAAAEARLHGS